MASCGAILFIWHEQFFLASKTSAPLALSNAGFDIGESMIAFDSSEPYWRAFWVGLLNTLRVSVVGIAFCTILGTLIGVGRVSNNALARGMGYAYTELFRNVPVLLQLLIWYVLLVEFMPDSQSPLHFNDWFYLSKNGISFPVPVWDASVPGLVWDVPVWLDGEITQGISLTPEFLAITLGLSFYTSAFVAEVVRAGIVSVPRGQLEAAKSIGLSNWQNGRVLGRGSILSGDSVYSVRYRADQQDINLSR